MLDWIKFDPSVIRGLSYYTGIVFEAFDKQGELRAVCGGDRYDKILPIYGTKPSQAIPAVGFGFGDCVIVELLQAKGLLPDLSPEIDDLVIPFSEEFRAKANIVATKLRMAGRRVDVQLSKKKVSWCYNYADRIGANRAVFVAPDEWERGQVRIKYLRADKGLQNEFDVDIDRLAEYTNELPEVIPVKEETN